MRPGKEISPLEILRALRASNGDVEAAAASLGVSGRTLYRRMSQHGIKSRTEYRVEGAA